MIALIDSDLVAYRCAASCQKQGVVTEDFGIAQGRASNLLNSILQETRATDKVLYLSGGENFRKKVVPTYKANRIDQEKPHYLEALREYLVVEWGAKVTDGIEADDALGIHQSEAPESTTVICSLDKDLKQVPGYHYTWEMNGTGSTGKAWKREAALTFVKPQEAMFNFYWQMVMGDRADNVPGFDGKMRAAVPKFLEGHYELMQTLETEQEMFDYVFALYDNSGVSTTQMLHNGFCLHVQRYEGDNWLLKGKQLLERSIMGDNGQLDVSIASLPRPSELVLDDGHLSLKL